MASFIFEVENLGQFSRVVEGLKGLDENLSIEEKVELNPFESDYRIKVQLEATYEEILKRLSTVKHSERALDTVRPIKQ